MNEHLKNLYIMVMKQKAIIKPFHNDPNICWMICDKITCGILETNPELKCFELKDYSI